MLKFTNENLKDSMMILGPGQTCVVKGTIRDSETGEDHEAAVVFGPYGIEIRLEGYGEKCADDGTGSPVFVEFLEGKAYVRVWEDIENENAKGICLEKARESRRFKVGDRVRSIAVGRPHLNGEIAEEQVIDDEVKFRVVENSARYDGHAYWFTAAELEKWS